MSTPPKDLDVHYNQPTPSTGHGQSSTGNPAQGHTNYGSSSAQHVVGKHGVPSPGTTSDNRAEERPYSSAASKSTQGPPRPASGQTTPMNFRSGQAESKPGASTPQQSTHHSFAAADQRQSEQGPPSSGRRQVTPQAPGYHDYDRATLSAQEPYKYPPKVNTPGRVSPSSPKSGRRSPPSPAASGRVPWRSLGYRSRSPKTSVLSPSRRAALGGIFNKGRISPTTRQPAAKPDQTQDNLEPVISPDATVDMETTESAPVKRRLNEGDVASQQRPTQEDQGQWRVAGPKKPRGAGRLRSSSLSRGGDGTTP
ncbi:hypothetical protein MTO96_020132 [Rhipicephalus appendiculatus]